jgi:hemolysin activation/secretion protein
MTEISTVSDETEPTTNMRFSTSTWDTRPFWNRFSFPRPGAIPRPIGVRGQYAFDYRLVPQASLTIGGLYSVRGYDQSVAVGDSVIIGSLEYRFHVPRAFPVAREPLQIPFIGDFRAAPQQVYGRPDWDLTLRTFLDVGRSIRNDTSNGQAGPNEINQTLVGAGVGAELLLKSNFRARIDWATALKGTKGDISNPTEVWDNQIYVLFSILY